MTEREWMDAVSKTIRDRMKTSRTFKMPLDEIPIHIAIIDGLRAIPFSAIDEEE